MGMVKFGVKREVMQNRIMNGIKKFLDEVTEVSSQEINPMHMLTNTVGNIVNDFVLGVTYDADDETWKYLQHLQEVGVKLVGVSAGANFLPILRCVSKYLIISTLNMCQVLYISFFLLSTHSDSYPSTKRT